MLAVADLIHQNSTLYRPTLRSTFNEQAICSGWSNHNYLFTVHNYTAQSCCGVFLGPQLFPKGLRCRSTCDRQRIAECAHRCIKTSLGVAVDYALQFHSSMLIVTNRSTFVFLLLTKVYRLVSLWLNALSQMAENRGLASCDLSDGSANESLFTHAWLASLEAHLRAIRVDKFLPLFSQLLVRLTTPNGEDRQSKTHAAFHAMLAKVNRVIRNFLRPTDIKLAFTV